jgi:hypothetical protein
MGVLSHFLVISLSRPSLPHLRLVAFRRALSPPSQCMSTLVLFHTYLLLVFFPVLALSLSRSNQPTQPGPKPCTDLGPHLLRFVFVWFLWCGVVVVVVVCVGSLHQRRQDLCPQNYSTRGGRRRE